MTESELRSVWLRWMHRRDVVADLDVVLELAAQRVGNRLMYAPEASRAELIEAAPELWVHAGLIELHELAQDDDGMMREEQRFEQSAQDHHLRRSLDGGRSVAAVPYLGSV